MDYLCCLVTRRRWHGERWVVRLSPLCQNGAELLRSGADLCGSSTDRASLCRSCGPDLCRSCGSWLLPVQGLRPHQRFLQQRLLQKELLESAKVHVPEAVHAAVQNAEGQLLQEELLQWLRSELCRACAHLRCSGGLRSDLCRTWPLILMSPKWDA